MRGTIVAQQWMVIYSLVCKPIYLSIVEVKRLCKNNKVKDMWLGGMYYYCCLSGFDKGISGFAFFLINAEQPPILKPQPPSGHGSRLLALVSARPLHQLWGVELNGHDQGGHGLHRVYWCLLPLLTAVVCDKPMAWTQLSYCPLKIQWLFRRHEDFESCHWVSLHSIKELQIGALALSVHVLLGISMERKFFFFSYSIRNCWCRIHQIH